jgi:hypothetical protein
MYLCNYAQCTLLRVSRITTNYVYMYVHCLVVGLKVQWHFVGHSPQNLGNCAVGSAAVICILL